MSVKISNEYMMLDRLSEQLQAFGTDKLTSQKLQQLDTLSKQLKNTFSSLIKEKENKLAISFEKLQALSPLNVLSRGYSILSKDNKNIIAVSQIDAGDTVVVRLSDGNAYCTVNNTERTV